MTPAPARRERTPRRTTRLAGALASLTAAALAATAVAGVGTASAGTAGGGAAARAGGTSVTDYGLQGIGYGTRVVSSVGLRSARSAFAYLLCTREAGISKDEHVATIDLPSDAPMVQVDGVDSTVRTFKNGAKDIAAAMRSTDTIARVQLGNADTPRFTLEGLTTQSQAWATKDGTFKTSNKVRTTDISLVNLPDGPVSGPLGDLLDATDGGIQDVFDALQANGGKIDIPGLGQVAIGFDKQKKKAQYALASSFVLKVTLYGADGGIGGGDDSLVSIGRSWAKITRDLPAGVMRGAGWGADADLVDGTANIGRVGLQPLPCQGTDGEVESAPTAGLDLANQGALVVDGLEGRSYGVQKRDGSATAWTDGTVASVTLGPLEIRGIRGRVDVAQDTAGRITKNSIKGSVVGELLVDGESQGRITPANADQLEAIEVPGLLDIDFFAREKGPRGGRVTAVVLTLAPDSAGITQIRLGNAQTFIVRK